MRESLNWTKRHKEPQTELVMYDPSQPSNSVMMALLERFVNIEGFDNTLNRIVIERARQQKARNDGQPT